MLLQAMLELILLYKSDEICDCGSSFSSWIFSGPGIIVNIIPCRANQNLRYCCSFFKAILSFI